MRSKPTILVKDRDVALGRICPESGLCGDVISEVAQQSTEDSRVGEAQSVVELKQL